MKITPVTEVKIDDDYIAIIINDVEAVCWHVDEWNEDPSIVPAIATAIKLGYNDPVHLLRTVKSFCNNWDDIVKQYKLG